MNNAIDVSVTFSFKGETYSYSAHCDLDGMMNQANALPDFHTLLARGSGVDTYSYLYEVMMAHSPAFSTPTGLAVECFDDGEFDVSRFETLWRGEQERQVIAEIAHRCLQVSDIEQEPALQEALLEAYLAGKKSSKKS